MLHRTCSASHAGSADKRRILGTKGFRRSSNATSLTETDSRRGYTTIASRVTYDVDELRQSKSELDGQFIAVVADRSNEFVVAVVDEEVRVQLLGVRVRRHL